MALVTSREMFEKAYNGGYAIGAFNVNNMEIIQGITEAAKECRAPVILQVSSGARKYANRTYLVKLVCDRGDRSSDLPASGPRRYVRALQELRGRRLHLRHDRRLLQVL